MKTILLAILAPVALAARWLVNLLPVVAVVGFAAIIGGVTVANGHSGLLSAVFSGNTAWAQSFRLDGKGCKLLVNGEWKSCSAQQQPKAETPETDAPELEKAETQTAEDAAKTAQEADLQARNAEIAAQQAQRAADAAKHAADAAKGQLGAAKAAIKAANQAVSAAQKAAKAHAKNVYNQCASHAGGHSTALSNCAKLRGQARKAAQASVNDARARLKAAKKASKDVRRHAKQADKAAKKAAKAAKKAAALAQIERDYATCIAAANADSTAIAACQKSRKSAIKKAAKK